MNRTMIDELSLAGEQGDSVLVGAVNASSRFTESAEDDLWSDGLNVQGYNSGLEKAADIFYFNLKKLMDRPSAEEQFGLFKALIEFEIKNMPLRDISRFSAAMVIGLGEALQVFKSFVGRNQISAL